MLLIPFVVSRSSHELSFHTVSHAWKSGI